ncbi:hypothetical protein C8R46DRAFT_1255974 [Mycena filopes]|nr:hypothetical protein C8R46DRAFT_1255974 [Mycena filopes]
MTLSDFLFSPTARVWNFRLLLLEVIAVWLFMGVEFGFQSETHLGQLPVLIWYPTFGFILLHHIAFLFEWPVPGLALLDGVLILLEICGLAAGFAVLVHLNEFDPDFISGPRFNFACIPVGISLAVSVVFRTATIVRSKGRFFRQRFAFLGGCSEVAVPYTNVTILLNRSIGRPLVRGESTIIVFIRALVLNGIGVGLPVYAVYAIFLNPFFSQVYTRDIAAFATANLGSPGGTAAFLVGFFAFNPTPGFLDSRWTINQVSIQKRPEDLEEIPVESVNCSVTHGSISAVVEDYFLDGANRLVECPIAWTSALSVSISIDVPFGCVVGVTALDGPPKLEPHQKAESDAKFAQLVSSVEPIIMVPGSRLFGRLTWSQRETLSRLVLGLPTGLKPMYIPQINGLQTYPPINAADTSIGINTATLLLYQPYTHAIKLQQDTTDTTPLSGLATFGGFWTFVNGAFALLFGANVVYFALGRRPLSALGLIHVFQRNTLVRRWNTDFPALRTEGGRPGSEGAGIVAFIRERLVDVGDDPHVAHGDLEASRDNLAVAQDPKAGMENVDEMTRKSLDRTSQVEAGGSLS